MLGTSSNLIRLVSGNAYRKLFFQFPSPAGFLDEEQWIQQQADLTGNQIETVVEETVLHRKPPRTVEPELHCLFEHWATDSDPAINVSRIKDGRVFGKNGGIITPENFLRSDLCGELGKSDDAHSLKHFTALPRPQQIDATVGVLSAFAANTYFHFLFDTISRIQFMQQRAVDYYFVNDRTGFQKQLLNLAGVQKNKIISAKRHSHLQTNQLIATSPTSKPGTVSKTVWQFLRNSLGQCDPSSNCPRKIYISRGDVRHRRVTNEAQVVTTLAKFGYVPVVLSNLTVQKQIQLFSQISHVVSPHGAGLSNLTYAASQTKVLELFCPEYINPCYWTLSQHGKLDYCYLLGTEPSRRKFETSRKHRMHITVDIEKLVASVKLMES